MLNDTIVGLATSEGWGRVMLVVATLVALEVILLASTLVPFRVLALTALALLTIALPAQGVYAFERLFRVNGTNGLPITLDQGGVFNWVDRALGKEARVSMLRYPVNPPDYYAGIGYWWDLEFWNESVVDTLDEIDGPGEDPWLRFFDRKTGAAASTGKTPFVYVYGNDVRFRLAGKQLAYDRGAYLFQAAQPWRAAWVAEDIYNDGWTRPHRPARITVFAEPGQRTPVKRFLTFAVASPDSERPRPVEISSNLADIKASVFPNSSLDQLVTVCVPPGGSSTVTVDTPLVSLVYRDPTQGPLTGEVDRPTGVLLRSIALADEIEPMERCP